MSEQSDFGKAVKIAALQLMIDSGRGRTNQPIPWRRMKQLKKTLAKLKDENRERV
jgi:hypothetical protein